MAMQITLKLRLIAGILLLTALCSGAFAKQNERIALVIGNGSYQNFGNLINPTRDAADIANTLRSIGFAVTELSNLDKPAFDRALAQFADESAGKSMAILYFAGHGMELDKKNFLIPVDARLESDRKVPFETISLDYVLSALDGVHGLRMVFLDACRNNPFLLKMTASKSSRSIGRGLSRVEASEGMVISFAAEEGSIALDGAGRNSPFSGALAKYLGEPGLEIQFLLRKVRDDVRKETGGRQQPFISASLPSEPIYLVPPPLERSEPDTAGNATIQNSIVTDYILAERVGTLEAWNAFLKKYETLEGNGEETAFYVGLANAALSKLSLPKAAEPSNLEPGDSKSNSASTVEDISDRKQSIETTMQEPQDKAPKRESRRDLKKTPKAAPPAGGSSRARVRRATAVSVQKQNSSRKSVVKARARAPSRRSSASSVSKSNNHSGADYGCEFNHHRAKSGSKKGQCVLDGIWN